MKYSNLKALLDDSSSSRSYFLSLPPKVRTALHEQGESIHSAEELHFKAYRTEKYIHSTEISDMEL